MNCSITLELQKDLLKYVVKYLENNPDASKETVVQDIMKSLYNAVTSKGSKKNFYYHNTISTIPFLINNNILTKDKGNKNKLYENYHDRFDSGVVTSLMNEFSGDDWYEKFNKSIGLKGKGLKYVSERVANFQRLDAQRGSYKPVYVNTFLRNGDKVVYVDSEGNYKIGNYAYTDGKHTIDSTQIEPVQTYNYDIDLADAELDEPVDIWIWNHKDDSLNVQNGEIFKVDFQLTEGNTLLDVFEKGHTPLEQNKKKDYKFYLSLYRNTTKNDNSKVGSIRHLSEFSEATDLEKKIIEAYIATGGNLYMTYVNGQFKFISPKLIYDQSKQIRVVKQPVKNTTDINFDTFITLNDSVRQIFHSGYYNTNTIQKNEQINNAVTDIVADTLANNSTPVIDGVEVHLTVIKDETVKPTSEEWIKEQFKNPIGLAVCDSSGNPLNFIIEDGQLKISDTGERALFDIFPFNKNAFKNIDENKNQLYEKLVADGMDANKANIISENFSDYLNWCSNLYDIVVSGESPIFDFVSINNDSYIPYGKESELQVNDKIIYQDGRMMISRKQGRKNVVLGLYSNYDEQYAKQLVEFFNSADVDFTTRKKILESLFSNIISIGRENHKVKIQGKKITIDGIVTYDYSSGSLNIIKQDKFNELIDAIQQKPSGKFGNKVPIRLKYDASNVSNEYIDLDGEKKNISSFPLKTIELKEHFDPTIVFELHKETNEETITENTTETIDENGLTPMDEDLFSQEETESTENGLNLEDELPKTIDVKQLETPATQKQIEEAKTWFENSPLSKHIEFTPLFGAVNKYAVAYWKKNGIALLNGSDYSDLYHESWHAFSQMFLTKEQKIALYDSIKNKKGVYKGFGKPVAFKDMTYKQVEEFLAESFRNYMLTGKIDVPKKAESFIKKIWYIIKSFFSKDKIYDVEELFVKLRVGEISEFAQSDNNIMFDKLNKSIKMKNSEMYLSASDTLKIDSLVDIYLADYLAIDNINKGASLTKYYPLVEAYYKKANELIKDQKLNKGQLEKLQDSIINEIVKDSSEKELDAKRLKVLLTNIDKSASDNIKREFAIQNISTFIASRARLQSAYGHARMRLFRKHNELFIELNKLSDKNPRRALIEEQIQTIDNAINNFGDINLLDKDSAGVVAQHFEKNFKRVDFVDSTELDIDEDNELNPTKNEHADNKASAQSAEERMGDNPVLKFILSTVPSYVLKKVNGKYEYVKEYNEFGEQSIKSFKAIKNRLVTTLEGCSSPAKMYERLMSYAYKTEYNYETGKYDLVVKNGKYVVKNPMFVEILNRLGDINELDVSYGQQMSNIDALNKCTLWKQFFDAFACPEVRSHQADIYKKRIEVRDEEGNLVTDNFGNIQYEYVISINATEQNGPLFKLDDYYRSRFAESAYTKVGVMGTEIDFEAVQNEFMQYYTSSQEVQQEHLADLCIALGLSITPEEDCVYKIGELIDFNNTNVNVFKQILNKVNRIVEGQKNGTAEPITDPINGFWKDTAYGNYLGRFFTAVKNIDIRFTEGINAEQVRNAEGNTQFMNQKNSTMTMLFSTVNEANDYSEILNNAATKHLDVRKYLETGEEKDGKPVLKVNPTYNPVCANSNILFRLFNFRNKLAYTFYPEALVYDEQSGKYKTIKNVSIINPDYVTRIDGLNVKLFNLSGIKVHNGDSAVGNKLFSSDRKTKVIADLIYMSRGEQEVMRHADNSVSYSVNVVNSNGVVSPIIASAEFNVDENNNSVAPSEFTESALKGIVNEMERILIIRDYKNKAQQDGFIYDRKYLNSIQAEMLGVYEDMLSKKTKAEIEKLLKNKTVADDITLDFDLVEQIKLDVNDYFQKTIDKNRKEINSALDSLGYDKNNTVDQIYKGFVSTFHIEEQAENTGDKIEQIIKLFTASNLFYNSECIKFIYGDVLIYNLKKDEFTKRIKGVASSGEVPCDDDFMNGLVFKMSATSYYSQVIDKNSPDPSILDGDKKGFIKTAVCSDVFPVSAYAKAYSDISSKYSVVEEESNAQGLITFDGYRNMCIRLGKWNEYKEKMFQRICKGEDIKPEEWIKFFPVLKLQFWGPVYTGNMPENGFHKYSLMPIIPTMVQGTNLESVHKKMLKEGITYITFNSGSKQFSASNNNDNNIKEFNNQYGDKLYDPSTLSNPSVPRQLAGGITSDEEFFTPNYIPLRFIKDQVLIHDELDPSVTFARQMRRVINNNLFSQGYPIDINTQELRNAYDACTLDQQLKMSPAFALAHQYNNMVNKLLENTKENVRRQFGLDSSDKFDQEKFLKYVKQELKKKDIPESVVDDLTSFEQIQFSPFRDEIEKIILSLINKKVITQKVHGGQYVQVASTLWEKPNMENDGTNDLRFYGFSDISEYSKDQIKVVKDGDIEPATIKIPLAGDFLNLLQANHFDGKKIENIKRLNQCLKNQDWVNKNKEAIMIVACRIPVQGYNSIENFRITEFLNPGCNNIIICPSELVIKSGGDYDIDKFSTVTPNIKVIDGECYVPMYSENGKLSKEKEEKEKKEISEKRNAVNKALNLLVKDCYKKCSDIIKKDTTATPEQKQNAATLLKRFEKLIAKRSEIINKLNSVKDNYDVEKVDDSSTTSLYIELSDVFKQLKKVVDDYYIEFDVAKGEYKEKGTGVSQAHIKVLMEEYDKAEKEYKKLFSTKYIKRKYNTSKAGLENSLIKSMSSVLESPFVRKSLLTPNATDYFTGDGKPKQILQERVYKEKEESKSPTTLIEYTENLNKMDLNKTGKVTLGPTALVGSFVPISKVIGLKMNKDNMKAPYGNPYYKKYKQRFEKGERNDVVLELSKTLEAVNAQGNIAERDKIYPALRYFSEYRENKLYLKHNEVKGQIDLSSKFDAEGDKEISDVISQIMNGCVDVAKDAWITYINGNPEAIKPLMFMVQAGVPIEQICYFIGNPVIVNYIQRKLELDSAIASLHSQRFSGEITARSEMLGIKAENSDTRYTMIAAIEQAIDDTKMSEKDFSIENLLDNLENTDPDSEYAQKLLAHFFMIEDMAKPVTQLMLGIRVDGVKHNSLYEVMERQTALEKMQQNPSLDEKAVSKITNGTVLSQFFISDMVREITGLTLPQKTNGKLNMFFEEQVLPELRFTGMDKADIFDKFFADFNSFLFQYNKKIRDDVNVSKLSSSEKQLREKRINNIKDKTLYNANTVESILEQISKLDERREEIKNSEVYKNWKEYFRGVDEDEQEEDILDEFITLMAAQSVGDEFALFGVYDYDSETVNYLNIGSKWAMVKQLVSRDKKLAEYIQNKIFYNNIISEPYNNEMRLLFASEMTTDEKGVAYEEFKNLDIAGHLTREGEVDSNGKALKPLSKFDQDFIAKFFAELPYYSLVQSGMSTGGDALTSMFDLSAEMLLNWKAFLQFKNQNDLLVKFSEMFVNKYKGNDSLSTNSYYTSANSEQTEESAEEQSINDLADISNETEKKFESCEI